MKPAQSRIIAFAIGFILPYLFVFGLRDVEAMHPFLAFLAWPASILNIFFGNTERWGWLIVIDILLVGIVWGLVAMAIEYAWEKIR